MSRKWRWVAAVTALVIGVASVAYAAEYYHGYRVVALLLDGRAVKGDVPAIIMDGRTLLPVRALSEAMGSDVAWDDRTYTVSLTSQPRLDAVRGADDLQMSMLGIRQQQGKDTGNDALAGRLISTVRFVNRGDAEQTIDLSSILLEDQAGGHLLPTVVETRGSKRVIPGTTKVVLAKGEEISAVLAYDLAPGDGSVDKTYRMTMVNSAGETQMALRIKVTVTIDCTKRPCTITIVISF